MAKRKASNKKKAAKPKKAQPSAKQPAKGAAKADDGIEDDADLSKLKKIFDEASRDESAAAFQYVDVECPHCGEVFEIRVDTSCGSAERVDDCRSCGKRISFFVDVDADDGQVSVSAVQI